MPRLAAHEIEPWCNPACFEAGNIRRDEPLTGSGMEIVVLFARPRPVGDPGVAHIYDLRVAVSRREVVPKPEDPVCSHLQAANWERKAPDETRCRHP